jgi:hypothetical protein
MSGSKGGGNTPPDSELRNIAIPLPELRKPVQNAIAEANQQFKQGNQSPWNFGPGVVQPWDSAQQNGYNQGVSTAGQIGNILNPSASLVSRVGGGEFVGGTPGQGTMNAFAAGGFVGQQPGQALLNRAGSGEFVGNTPGQGLLNRVGGGEFVGNSPGQGTLNAIAGGQFARPATGAYDQLLARAMGGSGGADMIRGTASGNMLGGNPYLQQVIDSQSRDIRQQYGDAVSGIEGRVSAAGRLGSNSEMDLQGRASDSLGRSLSDLESRTRYQDYSNERGYQQQAQLALPGAFGQEINTGLGAANARAGDEWQALQTMLQGSQAAGQGYRDSMGQAIQGAGSAANVYQNSLGQALQGAQAAGAGVRADQGLQLQGAGQAASTYQNSLAQALQGAGMAPQQAAAQFMGADRLMQYGGAAQGQAQNVAQEGQDRFRYGQEADWQNLQRYIQSLQGSAGLTNQNAGGLGLQTQQGPSETTQAIGNIAQIAGAAAMFASDRRLKTDIRHLGAMRDGAALYRYRYVWDAKSVVRVGPMAQELAEQRPEAVRNIGGVLMVVLDRMAA